jgi:hypothetical protein
MTRPHGLHQTPRIKRLPLFDQDMQSHEPETRRVRIELYPEQSLAGAVFQTDTNIRVRIVAACGRQSRVC